MKQWYKYIKKSTNKHSETSKYIWSNTDMMPSVDDRERQETERPQEGELKWRELCDDLNFMCKHFLTHNEVDPWSL